MFRKGPAFELSEKDAKALRQLSEQLREEVTTQYEDFVVRCKRNIDASKWRHARTEGGIHAFHELVRRGLVNSVVCGPQAALAAQLSVQRVMVTGTMPGELDDVMYGTAFHDSTSLRALPDFQLNLVTDATVVATIEKATIDDPFRFSGVTWFLLTMPLLTPVLLKRRDCLALTDSRTSTLSNGERVGIFISHSIDLEGFKSQRGFPTIRATSSLVRLFRQMDSKRVEVFAMHVLNVGGHSPDAIPLMASVQFIVPSMMSLSDGALRKKLVFLMRHRRRRTSRAIATASSTCGICEGKCRDKLFWFSGGTCQLCGVRICSRCCVPQQLVVDTTAPKPTTRGFIFCLQCLLHAKALSTRSIAQHEVVERISLVA